jgi:cytochrome oxidase Cu insertion factor (SCO1/SenC/PrrC family)
MAIPVLIFAAQAFAQSPHASRQTPQPTDENFRRQLGLPPGARLEYRDLDCKPVDLAGFVAGMRAPGAHADVDRAADGSAATMTVKLKGMASCPSPYPPVTEMPTFDLEDLHGRRVTSASLRGKPTLVSFFFSTCVPCILEVEPINRFAAARPHMNFLAVTFDAPAEADAFVKRYGLRWRVVPDAQDLVERMRVKQFPLMALFDARGKLLGTKKGGARDELEAANVEPQLKRWIEGLLKP